MKRKKERKRRQLNYKKESLGRGGESKGKCGQYKDLGPID